MSSSPPSLNLHNRSSTSPGPRPHDLYDFARQQQQQIPYIQYNSSPNYLTPSKPAPRASLPSAWLDQPDSRSLSPSHPSSDLSSGGTSPPLGMHMPSLAGLGTGIPAQSIDDEIIPTAIVIKNIPFTVKRETLLDIIASLSIPTPYAFNYHLDASGSFRGLAFANFRLPADADAVVAALNGFDVQGRKLRVEYKKVLQAGEKERIEREKAIRRMRSMQLEKESHLGIRNEWDEQQYGTILPQGSTTMGGGASGINLQFRAASPLYQGQQQQQQPIAPPNPSMSPPQPLSPSLTPSPPKSTSAVSASNELDLNDPSTLEIYSRILVFKEDRMRDELAFSRSLSPKQRRVVHLVAQKLGVYHYSVGEGEDRYAVVTRLEKPERVAPRTLPRSASSYLSPTSLQAQASTSPTRLRAKKSMPDLASLHTPPSRLHNRSSNGNIREGYATIATAPTRRTNPSFNGLFGNNNVGGSSVPPVPTLPPMPNGLVDPNTAGVVRQPRGPGTGGFGPRRASEANRGIGLESRTHEPLEI